jgi:ATP synthase F1 delta subunit
MENLTLASSVYGSALYEAADDLGEIEAFRDEISELGSLFKEYPDYFRLLATPTLDLTARKKIAEETFTGKVRPEVLNFIYVLIDKRRINEFGGIARAFETECDERNGITKGLIYSAVALSEGQLAEFEKQTSRLMQKDVSLENRVDASLIGGVKIYLEGKLIDASVRSQLDELREKLL